MDVPSPVDRATPTALARPGAPPTVPAGEARPEASADRGVQADPDLAARLAAVERQMAEMGDRLDRLAAAVPETLRDVVAEQVGDVSAELRHSISDLGRLLLRDLGRLTNVLADHRAQIVADLRAAGLPTGVRETSPGGGPTIGADVASPARLEPAAGTGESDDPVDVPVDVPVASEGGGAVEDASDVAKRRRGAHLLKRREG